MPPSSGLTTAQQRLLAFDTRIGFLCFLLHTTTQFSHLGCPWEERWQRLLSIPVSGAPWFLTLLAPSFYLRWRMQVYSWYKVAFFAFPLLRKPRGIQRVLDGDPSPGPLGFLLDVLKIAWGSRLFAVLQSGLATRMPIALHVPLQLYSVLMVRNNASLCKAPLTTAPAVVERMRTVNAVACGMLVPPLGQVCSRWLSEHNRDCSFFVTQLHLLVGVVMTTLPLLSAGWEEEEPQAEGGEDAETGWLDSGKWKAASGMQQVYSWWLCLQVVWGVAALSSRYLE